MLQQPLVEPRVRVRIRPRIVPVPRQDRELYVSPRLHQIVDRAQRDGQRHDIVLGAVHDPGRHVLDALHRQGERLEALAAFSLEMLEPLPADGQTVIPIFSRNMLTLDGRKICLLEDEQVFAALERALV